MKKQIEAIFLDGRIFAEASDFTRELFDKSRIGAKSEKKFQYTLTEALYLIEKDKIILKSNGRKMTFDSLLKKAKKLEGNFWTKFIVFKDLRNRGYIVKTALKFGADFRVYDKGIKPGKDHAKWIVYPVKESDTLTWYEFSAKNRVAHTTRKNLLIGIVDEESDVTYYEISWTRP